MQRKNTDKMEMDLNQLKKGLVQTVKHQEKLILGNKDKISMSRVIHIIILTASRKFT